MNIYLVVEGEIGEKAVYSSWIPFVNPTLIPIATLPETLANNVFIVSGGGYPNYREVIELAIADVTENEQFDRLVIAVDSEDETFEDKYAEIEEILEANSFAKDYRIVVQHFCLEAWALGNRALVTRNPQNKDLLAYKKTFDVSKLDPELLPPLPSEELNRAGFAEKYLRQLHNEKFRNLSYSKRNPRALCHEKYFNELKRRRTETGHIQSFRAFLDAFV